MFVYGLPLLTAFGIVFGLVPLIKKWALQIGFVDKPSKRKIHGNPIPLAGGLAIYAGCVLSMLVFDPGSARTWSIILGGTLLVGIGLIDDWHKSRGKEFAVWPRLIVYGIVSTVPLWFGLSIIGISNVANLKGDMLIFPVWFSWIATMIWVFAITNMINFIDGVDGLASGIAAISSITLLVIALFKGQAGTAVTAAVIAGASVAFLSYNYHPAKIFMGDAGAVFLGYTLAVTAVDGAFKSATLISMAVPILALGVPIMDTVIVFSRRLLEGRGFHRADQLHTHHRLMQWGLSQTQTVSFLYLVGAVFSMLSIILLLLFR